MTVGNPTKKEGVSSFSSLCTALAGSIGVGNTVGVAAALLQGGAGALFWMWIAGLCGMGIKYAEVYLSTKYRRGQIGGGAMDLLCFGLGLKKWGRWLGWIFLLSSFGIGNLSQSGAAVHAMGGALNIPAFLPAVFLSIFLLFVLWGGVRSVTTFTSVAIPLFSVVYCLFCLVLICCNISRLPQVIGDIFAGGVGIRSAGCGFSAALLARGARVGFARGLFSNEAGMGSTPIAYGMSNETDPQVGGMWGILEVFIDTIVMCTVTGLALLVSGLPATGDAQTWMMSVFGLFGGSGKMFLAISVAFFAFASMVAWGCYGQRVIGWLKWGRKVEKVYILLFCTISIGGAFFGEEMFFTLSDLTNALICLPNILCVWILSDEVIFPRKTESRHRRQPTGRCR